MHLAPDSSLTLPPLDDAHVHLWLVTPETLGDQTDLLMSFLSPDELARANTYKLPAPRQQFVLARGYLRRTLAQYLQTEPAALEFGTIANDKPVLRSEPGLQFNLSHTRDAIALAIARHRPVGVDIECIEPRRSMQAIAKQQFHVDEQSDLNSCEPFEQLSTFYRIWTCKEAYLKGLGCGFAQPLASFGMRPSGKRFIPVPPLDDQGWSTISVITPHHALAVSSTGDWNLLSDNLLSDSI